MTADLSITFGYRFFMESFKFPSLGKFFNSIGNIPTRLYSDMALKLIGVKDLMLSDTIKVDANIDINNLRELHRLLSFVKKSSEKVTSPKLIEIRESVAVALKTIDEIIEIIEEKKNYLQLKRDMFNVASSATLSNINKYKSAY